MVKKVGSDKLSTDPNAPSVVIGKSEPLKIIFRQRLALLKFVIPLILVMIAIIIGAHLFTSRDKVVAVPTEKQDISNTKASLENAPPTKDQTTSQKVEYYERLQRIDELDEDYQGAVTAFLNHEKLRASDLTYTDYMTLASYYNHLHDKTKSLAALQKADTLVPAKPNEAIGYDPTATHSMIEQLKSVYSQ